MKLSRTVILLVTSAIIAQADTVWAPGVSSGSGSFDYEKVRGNEYYNDDSGMCWAASASNIISWWQTQNAANLSGVALPNDSDTSPWDIFRILCVGTPVEDSGSNPRFAYSWWINGNKEYINWDEEQVANHPEWASGGFLKGVYSTSVVPTYIAGSDSSSDTQKAAAIVGALQDGFALSLEVGTSGEAGVPSAHAITLWGVDYEVDSNGNVTLTKAYVTDSDDKVAGIVSCSVKQAEGSIFLTPEKGALTNMGYNVNRADGLYTLSPDSAPAMQWTSASKGDRFISRDVVVSGTAAVGNLTFLADSTVTQDTENGGALGGSGKLIVSAGQVVFDGVSRSASSGAISIAAGASLELKNGAQVLHTSNHLGSSDTVVTVAGTLKLESLQYREGNLGCLRDNTGSLVLVGGETKAAGARVELTESGSATIGMQLQGEDSYFTVAVADGKKFEWKSSEDGAIQTSGDGNTLVLEAGKDATFSIAKAISADISLEKTGSGLLELSNTILLGKEAGITVSEGTLKLSGANNSIGTGIVVKKDAVLDLYWTSGSYTIDLSDGGILRNASSFTGSIMLGKAGEVTALDADALYTYGSMSSIISAGSIAINSSDAFWAEAGEEVGIQREGRMRAAESITLSTTQPFKLTGFTTQYGAMSAEDGSITITDVASVEVMNNSASDTMNMSDSRRAGALSAAENVVISAKGDINLSENTAAGNYNAAAAGAVFAGEGKVELKSESGNISLNKNATAHNGGAIYGGGDVTLVPGPGKSVQISGNKADGSGGAIYSQGKVTLSGGNYEISGNQAGNEGGAIFANSVQIAADAGDVIFKENTSKNVANDVALGGGSAQLSAANGHVLSLQGGITGAGDMTISTDELSTVKLGGNSSAVTLNVTNGRVEGIATDKARSVVMVHSAVVLDGAQLQDISLAGQSAAMASAMMRAGGTGATFSGKDSSYLFSDASLLAYETAADGTLTATATTPVLSGFSTIEGALELGISLDFIKAVLTRADGAAADVALTLVAGSQVGEEGFIFELDAASREWLAESDAKEYGFYDAEGKLLGITKIELPGGSTTDVVFGIKGITDTIPEPTTGTLSLLALAGMLLRRRRK